MHGSARDRNGSLKSPDGTEISPESSRMGQLRPGREGKAKIFITYKQELGNGFDASTEESLQERGRSLYTIEGKQPNPLDHTTLPEKRINRGSLRYCISRNKIGYIKEELFIRYRENYPKIEDPARKRTTDKRYPSVPVQRHGVL
nr:hypothetical protein Iba_chr14aCG10070 [Ipomoea batatas]